MKIVPLNHGTLAEWARFLPEAVFVELMQGNPRLRAAGVIFLREPQGAVVWEEREEEWILESIYVARKARRLGLGSVLLAYLSGELRRSKCPRLTVSYVQQDERRALTPFLLKCGYRVDTYEVPLGAVTLATVRKVLEKNKILRRAGGTKPLYQLTGQENLQCREWLFRKTGETMYRYMGENPASFLLMREGKIVGAVLLSREAEAISLDYCWIAAGREQGLFLLLADVVCDLSVQNPADVRIEMILSTTQAQCLYEHLFGEAKETVTLCRGSCVPLPEKLLSLNKGMPKRNPVKSRVVDKFV